MSLKNLWKRLTGEKEAPVMAQGNGGMTADEVNALLDDAKKNDAKLRAIEKQDKARLLLASLQPGECPKCHMISHHPMDQFFKWCANCDLNYSGLVYQNHQRSELGQIHDDFPDYSLKEVVEFYYSTK